MKTFKVILTSAVAAALFSAPAAFGGSYTAVGPGTPPEPSAFAAVLNSSPSPYLGFSDWTNHVTGSDVTTVTSASGGLTLTRVFDSGGSSPLNLGTGSAVLNPGPGPQDQVWHDGSTAFVAEKKFAGDTAVFGWALSSSPGTLNPVIGTGAGTTGSGSVGPGDFVWYLKDASTGGTTYYSDQTLNTGDSNADHMVTFELTGTSVLRKTWLLWWEDRNIPGGTLQDYQDSVIQITAVPFPLAAVAGMPLLGGVFAFGLKRKRDLIA